MNLSHPTQSVPLRFLRGSLAALLSLSLLLSGCTTLRTTALPAAGGAEGSQVKVGDSIVAHTGDGRAHAFKVTAIEPTAFVGKDDRVNFADLTKLEVRRIEPVGTTFLVIGGVALAAIIIVAASGGIAFMPSGPVM